MTKPSRDWPGNHAQPAFAACPGYKRPCGVSTLRPLCHFCAKSKQLDRKKEIAKP